MICTKCGNDLPSTSFRHERNECAECELDARRSVKRGWWGMFLAPDVGPSPETYDAGGKYIPAEFFDRDFPKKHMHILKDRTGCGGTTAFINNAETLPAQEVAVLIAPNIAIAVAQFNVIKSEKKKLQCRLRCTVNDECNIGENYPIIYIFVADTFLEHADNEGHIASSKRLLFDESHAITTNASFRPWVFSGIAKKVEDRCHEDARIFWLTATPTTPPDIVINTIGPRAPDVFHWYAGTLYSNQLEIDLQNKELGVLIFAPDARYVKTAITLVKRHGLEEETSIIAGAGIMLKDIAATPMRDSLVTAEHDPKKRIQIVTKAATEGWNAETYDNYAIHTIAFQSQRHATLTNHTLVQLIGRVRKHVTAVHVTESLKPFSPVGDEKKTLFMYSDLDMVLVPPKKKGGKPTFKVPPLTLKDARARLVNTRKVAKLTDAVRDGRGGAVNIMTLKSHKRGEKFRGMHLAEHLSERGGVLTSDIDVATLSEAYFSFSVRDIAEYYGCEKPIQVTLDECDRVKNAGTIKPAGREPTAQNYLSYVTDGAIRVGSTGELTSEEGTAKHDEFINAFKYFKLYGGLGEAISLTNATPSDKSIKELGWRKAWRIQAEAAVEKMGAHCAGRLAVFERFIDPATASLDSDEWMDREYCRTLEYQRRLDLLPQILDQLNLKGVQTQIFKGRLDRLKTEETKLRKRIRDLPTCSKAARYHVGKLKDATEKRWKFENQARWVVNGIVLELLNLYKSGNKYRGARIHNTLTEFGSDTTKAIVDRLNSEFGFDIKMVDIAQMAPRFFAALVGTRLPPEVDIYTYLYPDLTRDDAKKEINRILNSITIYHGEAKDVTQKELIKNYLADPKLMKLVHNRLTQADIGNGAFFESYTEGERLILRALCKASLKTDAPHVRLHDAVFFHAEDLRTGKVPTMELSVCIEEATSKSIRRGLNRGWVVDEKLVDPDWTTQHSLIWHPDGNKYGQLVEMREVSEDIRVIDADQSFRLELMEDETLSDAERTAKWIERLDIEGEKESDTTPLLLAGCE